MGDVVKPVHLMPVLCFAPPGALIALQIASLQPFLANHAGIHLGIRVEILRYLGQSPSDARNALVNKPKEQQDHDGGRHVGPHASAGLQDVILALQAHRNAP